jgi:hypothetical protein
VFLLQIWVLTFNLILLDLEQYVRQVLNTILSLIKLFGIVLFTNDSIEKNRSRELCGKVFSGIEEEKKER